MNYTRSLKCLTYIDAPAELNKIFTINIELDSTVSQTKKIIQKERKDLAIYDIELWRVNINFNEPPNDKYTTLLSYFDVSIEKELGGKRMSPSTKISTWFPHGFNINDIDIIIELPKYQINFTSCVDRKELVHMDKIIFKESSFELEGEIIITNVGSQIKVEYKSNIYMLDSFTEFINQVRKLSKKIRRKLNPKKNDKETFGGNATRRENSRWYMIKNLIIHLHSLNKNFSWLDFRALILEQRGLQKLPELGDQEFINYENIHQLQELLSIEDDFKEIYFSLEMSTVAAALVGEEKKRALIVYTDLPGLFLPFPLPTKFKGAHLLIDDNIIIPYHQNNHEKLVPDISISSFKSPNNACTLGLLIRIKKPNKNFEGSYILTTRHGVGSRGSAICQPGTLDNGSKGCASVTRYTSLSVNAEGRLIDYAICKLSNDHRVSINSNRPYYSGITVRSFGELGSSNSHCDLKNVKKSGRTTYVTKGLILDGWASFITTAFDPPKTVLVIPIVSKSFASPGNSGSPVFDQNGRVLGILHGGNESKCAVIPITLIKEHLKNHHNVEIELIGDVTIQHSQQSTFSPFSCS